MSLIQEVDRAISNSLQKLKQSSNELGKYLHAERALVILALNDVQAAGFDLDTVEAWHKKNISEFRKIYMSDQNAQYSKHVKFKDILCSGEGNLEGAYVLWAEVTICRQLSLQNKAHEREGELLQEHAKLLFGGDLSTRKDSFNKNVQGWGYTKCSKEEKYNYPSGDKTATVTRALFEAHSEVGLKGIDKAVSALLTFARYDTHKDEYQSIKYPNPMPLGNQFGNEVVRALVFNTIDFCDTGNKNSSSYFQKILNSTGDKFNKLEMERLSNSKEYASMFAYEYTDYLTRNDLPLTLLTELVGKVERINIINIEAINDEKVISKWKSMLCMKIRSLANLRIILNGTLNCTFVSGGTGHQLVISCHSYLLNRVDRISVKAGPFLRFEVPLTGFSKNSEDQRIQSVDLNGKLWELFRPTDLTVEYTFRQNGEKRTMTSRVKAERKKEGSKNDTESVQ